MIKICTVELGLPWLPRTNLIHTMALATLEFYLGTLFRVVHALQGELKVTAVQIPICATALRE